MRTYIFNKNIGLSLSLHQIVLVGMKFHESLLLEILMFLDLQKSLIFARLFLSLSLPLSVCESISFFLSHIKINLEKLVLLSGFSRDANKRNF